MLLSLTSILWLFKLHVFPWHVYTCQRQRRDQSEVKLCCVVNFIDNQLLKQRDLLLSKLRVGLIDSINAATENKIQNNHILAIIGNQNFHSGSQNT